ncbi:MAG: hypothetical protein JEY99_08020 [Spirochaetales bacterium]|nr:hypothetical protein [Spirochaetales bacterium]
MILLLPFGLYAGGQKEGDLLVQVEKLIEERHYNEAISLVTQVAKDEPSRFDDVNKLLQKILLAQKEYNEKYANLLDTYETDLQESYVLIKELEDMNPDANERTRQSLIRARETAGFVFNRNRWEEIMAAGLEEMNAGNYWEAVEIYRSGFDLSKDIFDDFGYEPAFISRVDTNTNKMNTTLDRFAEMKSFIDTHRDAENTAFREGDLTGYTESFNLVYDDLRELSELMVLLDVGVENYDQLELDIRTARGDEKEIHHLIYLTLLLHGRDDLNVQEGIFGALEEVWNEGMTELTEHTGELFRVAQETAFTALRTGELRLAEEALPAIPEAAVFEQRAISLWTGRLRPGTDGSLNEGDKAIADRWIIRSNDVRYKSLVSRSYLDYITGYENIDQIIQASGRISDVAQGLPLRSRYQEQNIDTLRQIETWEKEAQILATRSSEWIDDETKGFVDELIAYFQGSKNDIYEGELALLGRMGALEREILEARLVEVEALYSEGLTLLQGIPLEITTGGAEGEELQVQEILAVYPDRAVEALSVVSAPLSELKAGVRAVKEALSKEPLEFRETALISALVAREDTMLDRINIIENGISSNIAAAEEEIFTAQRFRQEGDRRLNESQQLLARGQYPAAKERLTAASLRYDESLIHQEDSALRTLRDIDIPELFAEIQREENKLVIRQVREYLTEGQNLYSQTNFAGANTQFLRAQNRWADTNVEANSEVEYWLELTKTALSVTTGREIAQTDPLFTEMIQYLNQATEDYITGVSHMGENNSDDADLSFNQAERNLLYVQQFFPFNKDARVLTIKIAQQRDPQGFKDLFSKDFTDARRQISTNPQQAYVELKDLEAIDPRYPGLQAAIVEAEYATGIKVRPADPRKIARSQELYADAQAIFNSNNQTEFQVALAYLDEAIALNSNYQAAIRLKDSVAVAMGGTSSEVLSSADQQKFQEAVAEFTSGNYLKAQIIVDILLNNADNRNNTRLLELKERIDSVR